MPDAELLFEYNNRPGWTAEDSQQKMLEEAKNRILNDNIDFIKLFSDKFFVFLSEDSAAVSYAEPALDNVVRYTVASNIFYYFLIVTSILGVLIMIKNKTKSILFMICLYTIGLTMAQLLVEVASRYHYSTTIPMIILSAFGINYAYNKKENIDINKKA